MKTKILLLLISIFFISFTTFSQHKENHHTEDHNSEKHSDDHNQHANHLALFTGATTNFDHETTGFSIGIDYEYRLKAMHGKLGIGLIGE